MAGIEEIRDERIKKLETLYQTGSNPYPVDVKKDYAITTVIKDFSKLSKRKKPIFIVGRVMAMREHGGSLFLDINDGTDKFQVYVKKNELGKKDFDLFLETIDIGDFVECGGHPFLTKKKEKTLKVKSIRIITKSLRPLPDKWHGLKDTEERFRKRYLDILMSPEVKERFITRSKIVTELRKILDEEEFLEVETPALQPLPGGASALPFVTHHNALDIDLYLRISDELYLKRLLVAGFPKVYEIGRDFRNEGIDTTHNPEFSMLEYYEAYSDAEKQMEFIESIINILSKKISGKKNLTYQGNKITINKKFRRVRFYDFLKKEALINDPENIKREELALKAERLGISVSESDSREKIMDNIFKKVCRPKIIEPTFIVEFPVDYLPLAKKCEGSKTTVDAFQLVIGGLELVKAFSELNDPIDQRERFEAQECFKDKGEHDAQSLDEDFLTAIEYGMPPAGGVGIGIDRLVMLFTDTKNIREVIIFPTLRPSDD